MVRSSWFLYAVMAGAALAPTLAHAEPATMAARRGGVGGAGLRGGQVLYEGGEAHPLLGLEAWAGYSPDGQVAYLARVSLGIDADWNDSFTELGVAARIWAPGGRFYIEPQLGLGSDETPVDCGGPYLASDCGPYVDRGPVLGVTGGLELIRRPQVALDLRVGFSDFILVDHDDARHVTVGLALTGF